MTWHSSKNQKIERKPGSEPTQRKLIRKHKPNPSDAIRQRRHSCFLNLHNLVDAFYTTVFALVKGRTSEWAHTADQKHKYGTLFSQFERFVCPQVCEYRKLPTKYKRWKTAETQTTELQMSATMQNSVIHLSPNNIAQCAIYMPKLWTLRVRRNNVRGRKVKHRCRKLRTKSPKHSKYIYIFSAKTFTTSALKSANLGDFLVINYKVLGIFSSQWHPCRPINRKHRKSVCFGNIWCARQSCWIN